MLDNSNHPLIQEVLNRGNEVLLGKETRLKLAIAALLSNSHLLINDLPGVGKTTLANLIARLFDLQFQRIQFTSDLLPADITGISIYNQSELRFEFHRGPIFAQLVLADELNRATPKSQSALLEAMEDRQVSVEGVSHPLPSPFFVIATQNPSEQSGTFPLPESQLDRFLLGIDIGYPDQKSEKQMLLNEDPRKKLPQIKPVVVADQLLQMQEQVERIHCADASIEYLQRLVTFTRSHSVFPAGYSPRTAMGILRASKAWAYIDGRNAVLPEDIQAILPSTSHHLLSNDRNIDIKEHLIKRVSIP